MIGSSGMCAFLNRPGVLSVRVAMAMRRKESAPMFPEQRPDLFVVRLWKRQCVQFLPFEELERAFAMAGGELAQTALHFEQKHQPMRLPRVTVLADQAR